MSLEYRSSVSVHGTTTAAAATVRGRRQVQLDVLLDLDVVARVDVAVQGVQVEQHRLVADATHVVALEDVLELAAIHLLVGRDTERIGVRSGAAKRQRRPEGMVLQVAPEVVDLDHGVACGAGDPGDTVEPLW